MPYSLTPSDTFSANVQVPNNGEPADQAAWAIGAQPLDNRTTYLRNRIPAASATGLEIEIPLIPADPSSGAWPDWDFASAGLYSYFGFLTQSSVAIAAPIRFRLSGLPRFPANITGIRARMIGANGATTHSAVPATVPRIQLIRYPLTSNQPAGTTVAEVQKTFANVAEYNAAHDVTTVVAGALPALIDPTQMYHLYVTGETGTNSVANALLLMGLYVTLQGT